MTTEPKLQPVEDESFDDFNPGLVRLLAIAAIAGILVGAIGGAFHWLLDLGLPWFLGWTHSLRDSAPAWLPAWLIAMVVAGLSIGLARYLVKFAPQASGSGVQHIEAVMRNQATPAPGGALLVKFFGGLLAMVPGMALGREGPTIQMAAVIGSLCGKFFRLPKVDQSLLYASVAGCGLSVAFNAPVAGIIFVIEEVAKRISVRQVLVTVIAVVTGITVYRYLFGGKLIFSVSGIVEPKAFELLFYLLLGLIMGALGVFYNSCILFGLNRFTETAPNAKPWIKAGIIGTLIGLLGYVLPDSVGGGEHQVNVLLAGQFSLQTLLALLVIRWLLGPLSYSAGTPGGLFAPLLLTGSILGALFAILINTTSGLALDPAAFALVAMSAFFTGIVRAPLTGILLICEMSGTVTLMLPLLLSSVGAMVTASLLRGEPIYDSLRERMLLAGTK